MSSHHKVYAMAGECECGRRTVKIGFSSNPEERLRTMQAHSPFPVRILATGEGGSEQEAKIHKYFHEQRIHGEWFDLSEAEVEDLVDVIEGRLSVQLSSYGHYTYYLDDPVPHVI